MVYHQLMALRPLLALLSRSHFPQLEDFVVGLNSPQPKLVHLGILVSPVTISVIAC
jgi:hypothetical protein